MFLKTRVCDSVHGSRGGCLSACWDTTPPQERGTPRERKNPPGKEAHPRQGGIPREGSTPRQGSAPPRKEASPGQGSITQHTVNERPVRILLECILVFNLISSDDKAAVILSALCLTGRIQITSRSNLSRLFALCWNIFKLYLGLVCE